MTDFHIVKHADPSAEPYEIPEDIVDARRNARAEINKLEAEIEVLEEELKKYIETIDEIEL